MTIFIYDQELLGNVSSSIVLNTENEKVYALVRVVRIIVLTIQS